MQGVCGGGGEWVDDWDARDAKDDVMMTVMARIIMIMIAWLSGTQSSQGEELVAVALLSSSVAMTISAILRNNTPVWSFRLCAKRCCM